MANEKRKTRESDDEKIEKKKIRKASMKSINYDFFHDKPEYVHECNVLLLPYS